MEKFKTLLTIFFATVAAYSVARAIVVEYKNRNFVISIWKRFRFLMFLEVTGLIIGVIIIVFTLMAALPFLKYGWTSLFMKTGSNILTGPMTQGASSPYPLLKIGVLLFFAALLVMLPFFAKKEEKMFRYGHEQWPDIITQSIKFGLIHLVVGVPLAVAIALIFAGLFFGYKYKKAFEKSAKKEISLRKIRDEALMVSTTYHALYNTVIVLLILVAVASLIF